MANENKDVLRVEAAAAAIEATLRERQLGFVTDTLQLAFKTTGGTTHYYNTTDSGNLYTDEYVYHRGDIDTAVRMLDDRMILYAGGVQFLDLVEAATDYASFFTNLLYIDNTNERICIGANSPRAKLHLIDGAVATGITALDSGFLITDGTGCPRIILEDPSGTSGDRVMDISLNSDLFKIRALANDGASTLVDNILTIDPTTGNVGFGTANPGYSIDVNCGTENTAALFKSTDANCWVHIEDSSTTAGYVRAGAVGNELILYSGNGTTLRCDTNNHVIIGPGLATSDGTLHVHTATAGTVTATASGNTLVLEASGAAGMSILVPDDANGTIYFGSPSDNVGAAVRWNHDASLMTIGAFKAGGEIAFVSGNNVEAIHVGSAGAATFNYSAGASADFTVNHNGSGIAFTIDVSTGNISYLTDGVVQSYGAGSDVSLTHVHNTGLLLNSDNVFQFRDPQLTIGSGADGYLDFTADTGFRFNGADVDFSCSNLLEIGTANFLNTTGVSATSTIAARAYSGLVFTGNGSYGVGYEFYTGASDGTDNNFINVYSDDTSWLQTGFSAVDSAYVISSAINSGTYYPIVIGRTNVTTLTPTIAIGGTDGDVIITNTPTATTPTASYSTLVLNAGGTGGGISMLSADASSNMGINWGAPSNNAFAQINAHYASGTPYMDFKTAVTGGYMRFYTNSTDLAGTIDSSQIWSMPSVYSHDMNGETIRDLQINSSGELGYDSGSRMEWKTDIEDFDSSFLQKLNVFEFEYREKIEGEYSGNGCGLREYGLDVRELSGYLPEKNSIIYIDDNGEPLGINYKKLVPALVKELQRLNQLCNSI